MSEQKDQDATERQGDAERFDSTSDQRTSNNAMRHTYRTLSDAEKALMQRIKDTGADLLALLHEAGGTHAGGQQYGSRELSIAATNAEQAVMWAVKHVTR